MTRGRLVARVASAIGLSTKAGSAELTLLDEWANEGVVDVLERTHCRVELGDMTLIANVADYRVDSSVLALDEETITSLTYDVELVTPGEIYQRRLTTATSPGSVTAIAVEGDLLLVYPIPTEAVTIRYMYVAKPTPMSDDSHDPSDSTYGGIPTSMHDCIEAFMLWKASLYDGTRAPLTPTDYLALYEKLCANARKKTQKKGKRGLYPTKVGYPNTRRAGIRNDTYPTR